jgi:hypothetical protein
MAEVGEFLPVMKIVGTTGKDRTPAAQCSTIGPAGPPSRFGGGARTST